MKLLATILGSALSAQTYAGADTIDCPARCWEMNPVNGCVPMADKLRLDCSDVGKVLVEADACLFTPENADYAQNYTVFFEDAPAVPQCEHSIDAEDDTLRFNMTYSQAEQCGWEWGSAPSGNITFGSFLKPSDNINKVNYHGIWVTISDMIQSIDLTCLFDSKASISIDMENLESTAQQNSNQSEFVSLADGFSVTLFQGVDQQNSFTVGEQVTAKFDFDHQAAGYAVGQMPFGFFAERCVVENNENPGQKLALVGGTRPDTCVMNDFPLNLHVSQDYKNLTAGDYGFGADWTIAEYKLEFDAFKMGGSTNLTLTCDFQLCLDADCPSQSDVDCAAPHTPPVTCFSSHASSNTGTCDNSAAGTLIASSNGGSISDCEAACVADDSCQFYTHIVEFMRSNVCELLTNCDTVVPYSLSKGPSPYYQVNTYEKATGPACPAA